MKKNRNYFATNSAEKAVLGFHVDDKKLVSEEKQKCDYCLIVENDICFLIELKGSDLVDACNQIAETMKIFTERYNISKYTARIVTSKTKTQELESNEYKKLENKMKKIKAQYKISYKAIEKTTREMHDII